VIKVGDVPLLYSYVQLSASLGKRISIAGVNILPPMYAFAAKALFARLRTAQGISDFDHL
jgi:hypothetical protein